MNSTNGGNIEEHKENPFLESHSVSDHSDASLTYSISSSQSFDKKVRKQLKKQAITRSIFLSWRAYAVQVKQDKVLFVKIRDFIIRRLTKSGFKALKLHYIKHLLIRHFLLRQQQRLVSKAFNGWQASKQHLKHSSAMLFDLLSHLTTRLALASAFHDLAQHSLDQTQLRRALSFCVSATKRKVITGFQLQVQERGMKREWALKVMISQEQIERELYERAYEGFRRYVKVAKKERRMRVKALKLFARNTKKHGLTQWKAFLEVCQDTREKNLIALNFQFQSQQKLLSSCFKGWLQFQSHFLQQVEHLFNTLSLTLQLRPALNHLQLFSSDQEALILQRRKLMLIKLLRQNVIIRKQETSKNISLLKHYQKKVIARALKAWRQAVAYIIQQRSELDRVLKKLEMRQAFKMIQRASFINQGLDRVQAVLNARSLRQAFRWLKIQHALQVVFTDDRMSLINLRLRFHHWKEASECDRRLAKMLIRAAKHHNRKLLPRAFRAMKRLVRPEVGIMPSRVAQLERLAIQRWRQYVMKRRVARYMQLKADEQYRRSTQQKFLENMRGMAQQRINKRQRLETQLKRFKVAKYKKVVEKCMKAFKTRAYLKRVFSYLTQQRTSLIRATYFQCIKDSYLSHHTSAYKTRKGEEHHALSLLSKTLSALYHYRKVRFIKQVKQQRALNFYCQGLMRLALAGLWGHRTRKSEKRGMLEDALVAHQKEKLQGCMMKLVSVGIYWAQIKGRFGAGKHSRIYLGLKYGLRWRARALMTRFKPKSQQGQVLAALMSEVQPQITEVIRKQLFPQPKSLPLVKSNATSMLARSSVQFNVPMRPMSSTQRLPAEGKAAQDRLQEIDYQITSFKQKRLLLKELEEQLSVVSQSSSQSPVVGLLSSKIQALRSELQSLQPKIKDMLQEIAQLKTQQTKQGEVTARHILMSPALSSIQQAPRRLV